MTARAWLVAFPAAATALVAMAFHRFLRWRDGLTIRVWK